MNRRDFLKTAGLGSVSLAIGASVGKVSAWGERPRSPEDVVQGRTTYEETPPGVTTNGKPNIVVIISDEHNAGVLGCYGNRIVQTPNLDKLAAGGTLFENCYCNSPLCVPSRLAFTAGKYVSRVGAWNNSSKRW